MFTAPAFAHTSNYVSVPGVFIERSICDPCNLQEQLAGLQAQYGALQAQHESTRSSLDLSRQQLEAMQAAMQARLLLSCPFSCWTCCPCCLRCNCSQPGLATADRLALPRIAAIAHIALSCIITLFNLQAQVSGLQQTVAGLQEARAAADARAAVARERCELAEARLRQGQEAEALRLRLHSEREQQFEQLSQVRRWCSWLAGSASTVASCRTDQPSGLLALLQP